MKTALRTLAFFSAALLMFGSLVGCAGTPVDSSVNPSTGGDRAAKIAAEPATISFLALDYDANKSIYDVAIERFKKQYNKEVKLVQAGADQKALDKVAANIAAKDPIDVFVMVPEQYLNMIHENYLSPVEEYVTVPESGEDRIIMDTLLSYDGHYYGYGAGIRPYVLFYNKDLLVENGYSADYPKEQYEAGTWTWDTFRKLARDCTDVDAGIMGLENMFDEVFQATNKAAAVTVGADKKYSLNIKTPAMRETLEFVADIFKTNPICGNGYVSGQARFLTGKALMHGAFSYEEAVFAQYKNAGTIKFDYGVTAFPQGPSNDTGVSYANTNAYGMSIGAKAPYSAGAFIDILAQVRLEQVQENQAALLPGSAELYSKLSENVYIPAYTDGVLENGFGAFYLLYAARQGEDISTSLDTYETTYKKMIDDANARID